jgi:hypothetical protein
MIVKSARRAGSVADARDLLRHLLHGAGNEKVLEIGLPGCIRRALDDARVAARDGRDAAWHVSLSPALPLTAAQWAMVEEALRLGLTRFRGHPEAFTRGAPDAQDASAVFA